MTVKLVLNDRSVECLKKQLGEDRVRIISTDEEPGYSHISFEVNNGMDILHIFHAGVNSGLALGLYGPSGKLKN